MSLWELTKAACGDARRFVADAAGTLDLQRFAAASNADVALHGQSVLISADRQLPAVQALLALDGVARRVLLCPPDLRPDDVRAVMREANVDTVVSDGTGPAVRAGVATQPIPDGAPIEPGNATEWLLFTSGTTGRPKLVVHSLASLAGPLQDGPAAPDLVWSTFYDIRRYGGLQILLRALLGGGSMVLSQSAEPMDQFLRRAGELGVTHLLGTPSHWRLVLMSGMANEVKPLYVRLSGEIADQAILDKLAEVYPQAVIVHAFASTEAGVGFEVRDGLAGFPISYAGNAGMAAEIQVADGALRLRSSRIGRCYLGDRGTLAAADGFVETGDVVERVGDRYLFAGRREGIINVGGQKIHPEEVEAVMTRHASVHVARVFARPNPIMGAIVAAELVLRADAPVFDTVRDEVFDLCRSWLPPYKVPASIRQVETIAIAPSGKIARPRA